MIMLFVRVKRRFQQFFSHISTASGCVWELSAHFYSAASLKYDNIAENEYNVDTVMERYG